MTSFEILPPYRECLINNENYCMSNFQIRLTEYLKYDCFQRFYPFYGTTSIRRNTQFYKNGKTKGANKIIPKSKREN